MSSLLHSDLLGLRTPLDRLTDQRVKPLAHARGSARTSGPRPSGSGFRSPVSTLIRHHIWHPWQVRKSAAFPK